MYNRVENDIIQQIKKKTRRGNIDNIARTQHYETFYFCYKEIKWALLAGIVSRNAGWNMCDLAGKTLAKILPESYRTILFSFLEKANWLIFQDAYPQLLLYHYTMKLGRPLFHLLPIFNVSNFMLKEWQIFLEKKDVNRLLYALIINEQNLIQLPIIINPFYQKYIIDSFPFKLQDICNFNYLLLPTMNGELFGLTIHKFHSLDRRIEVGKSLAQLLFHAKNYWKITEFVQKTTHTGSRSDYERYIQKEISRNTPYLRLTYPIIEHRTIQLEPWDQSQTLKKEWFTPPKLKKMNKLTKWYFKKRKEMELFATMIEWKNIHNEK